MPTPLIQLETLKKEYDIVLIEYEQSQKNILNTLNKPSHTLISLPNSILTGGTILDTITTITNEKDCIANCTANTSCTGATFKTSLHECTLYSDKNTSKITASINMNDYAIVSELKSNIYNSKGLNSKLQSINQQINVILDTLVPLTQQQINDKNKSKLILHNHYKALNSDRKLLQDQQTNINNINNKYSSKNITTRQINDQYIVWVIFTIIVLSITIILFTVPNINILEKYPLILLFIILLIAYFIYNYLNKINISSPNIDIAYNINKLNYFNY